MSIRAESRSEAQRDPPSACSIVIAEDNPDMRAALVRILSRRHNFVVLGEAADGEQAVRLCIELRPDIALMDIRMPRMTGIEATRHITRLVPTTRVIALTSYPTADYVLPMIRAGASGYILKDFSTDELFAAIATVLGVDHRFAIAPALVRLLAEHATTDRGDQPTEVIVPAGSLKLTPREQEVVTWLARGLSNRAIAGRMYLSEASVKAYLNHITTKLGVSDRVQVLIRCYELGLVNPSLSSELDT